MKLVRNMLKITIVLLVIIGGCLAIGLPFHNSWWFVYSFTYIIVVYGVVNTYPDKINRFLT